MKSLYEILEGLLDDDFIDQEQISGEYLISLLSTHVARPRSINYNKSTKRWDVDGSITIDNSHSEIFGNIPWGVVSGQFYFMKTTLKASNLPTRVSVFGTYGGVIDADVDKVIEVITNDKYTGVGCSGLKITGKGTITFDGKNSGSAISNSTKLSAAVLKKVRFVNITIPDIIKQQISQIENAGAKIPVIDDIGIFSAWNKCKVGKAFNDSINKYIVKEWGDLESKTKSYWLTGPQVAKLKRTPGSKMVSFRLPVVDHRGNVDGHYNTIYLLDIDADKVANEYECLWQGTYRDGISWECTADLGRKTERSGSFFYHNTTSTINASLRDPKNGWLIVAVTDDVFDKLKSKLT